MGSFEKLETQILNVKVKDGILDDLEQNDDLNNIRDSSP